MVVVFGCLRLHMIFRRKKTSFSTKSTKLKTKLSKQFEVANYGFLSYFLSCGVKGSSRGSLRYHLNNSGII